MWILVSILILIILLLSIVLLLEQKELKRIQKELAILQNRNTNTLISSKTSSQRIKKLILEMNKSLQKGRTAQRMYDQKYNALKKMIRNISHDLRTPLTSALGYIDFINHSDLNEKDQRKYLRIIEERLKHLSTLMEHFFEFSKLISERKEISFEPVNVISVVEECIAHYYEDYHHQNRKIIFKKDASKYQILSNSLMLKRIIDNLIGNALKHSQSNLWIEVHTKENFTMTFQNKLDDCSLDVSQIFDEFYTADMERSKGNTGLGLAIAKELTNQLNGTITATKQKDTLKIVLKL